MFKAIGHKISFFPFVVFENQIAAGAGIENLMQITDTLLSNHPAQASVGADASELH